MQQLKQHFSIEGKWALVAGAASGRKAHAIVANVANVAIEEPAIARFSSIE
jgi:hypothetical protein